MNQYIFCAVVDGQIQYGFIRTATYEVALGTLEARYHGRDLKKLEVKAITNDRFEFDVVGGVTVC